MTVTELSTLLFFLDGATCKFLDAVQSCGKVLHVLIELLFGYLCVNLRRLDNTFAGTTIIVIFAPT